MYLTFRNARIGDLEQGYELVAGRYRDMLPPKKDLLRIWRFLLEADHQPSVVSEDMDRPEGERLVAFGNSFFAHDWFIREAKTSLPPFLPKQVVKKWLDGKSPFLREQEIVQEQIKGGVNVVAFTWGWDTRRYSPEDTAKIMENQTRSYIPVLSRYRFKEFIQENLGEMEKDWVSSYGVDILRDYKEFTGTPDLPDLPRDRHPYLIGFNVEEVRGNVKKGGTFVSNISRIGPPRYGFRLGEQAVLKVAIEGGTDEEIAKVLGLSLVTVKKRWQDLYEKVSTVDPGFLEELQDKDAKEPKQKQRRRILLQRLKDHPEEFWPNELPRKAKVPSGK